MELHSEDEEDCCLVVVDNSFHFCLHAKKSMAVLKSCVLVLAIVQFLVVEPMNLPEAVAPLRIYEIDWIMEEEDLVHQHLCRGMEVEILLLEELDQIDLRVVFHHNRSQPWAVCCPSQAPQARV